MVEALLLIHLVSTLMMAGLIWFVQIVHYPLFARAAGDPGTWRVYEAEHQTRTTFVVGPLMLAEAVSSAGLLALRPAGVSVALLLLSVALVAIVWALTFFLAVPLHAKLSRNFDRQTHRRLVLVNWPRTAVWSARGIVALIVLRQYTGWETL